jgi:hypothetical protein
MTPLALPSLPRNGGNAGLGRQLLTAPRFRRRAGARSRRQPRRGTCVSLTTESLRPCLTEQGIATLGDLFSTTMARHPCDLSAADSPNNPIRHERQSNFTAARVHAQRSQRRHIPRLSRVELESVPQFVPESALES